MLWQRSRGRSSDGQQGLRTVWVVEPVQTARVQNAADEENGLELEANTSR